MLKIGFRAAETREPRQIRKEAAVSGKLRVPRSSLIGVDGPGKLGGSASKEGCTIAFPDRSGSIIGRFGPAYPLAFHPVHHAAPP